MTTPTTPKKRTVHVGHAGKACPHDRVVMILVYNILNNVMYVLAACKCKKVETSHLKAVSTIQSNIKKNNIGYIPKDKKSKVAKPKKPMAGGAQVLPSEYFGVDSGRYYDIADVAKLETNMFADSALARSEMPLKFGGCRSMQDNQDRKLVEKYISKFLSDNNLNPKYSDEVTDLIHASVKSNISEFKQASKAANGVSKFFLRA